MGSINQPKHSIKVDDVVEAPDGYFPDGSSRPRRRGVVKELYGPSYLPLVQFEGELFTTTCVAHSLNVVRTDVA